MPQRRATAQRISRKTGARMIIGKTANIAFDAFT
jgi:hypothetical protein